jgi:protein-disulfide isomerase
MSFYRMSGVLVVVAAACLRSVSALADPVASPSTNLPAEAPILATVNGHPVTAAEIELALRIPLYDLDTEKYRLTRRRLDQVIAERLIEQAAVARGVTVAAFVSSEIQARVPPIPQTEEDARFRQVREQLPQQLPQDEAAAKQLVRNALIQERAGRALQDLVEGLSREAKVSIAVHPPDPPVIQVPVGDDPALGPAAAPVTIVEFGDFECPVCKETLPVLQRLRSLYPEQVRFVYRDFPIAAHPQARAAAEAAQCAHEQGQFWAYHDALFTQAPDLKPSGYLKLAESLKLNTGEFAACLTSNRPKAAVAKDLADARRLGLSGTPTFFVNGRYLAGLQTLEGLREMVDRELSGVTNGSRGQTSMPGAGPR